MNSKLGLNSIFIANPFLDYTEYVPEEFLKTNGIKENEAVLDFTGSLVKDLSAKIKTFKDQLDCKDQSIKNQSDKEIVTTLTNRVKARIAGSGVNVMLPFVKFKLDSTECAILGRIGDKAEEINTELVQHFNEMGVNSLLINSKDLSTGTVLCLITEDSEDHERTMVTHVGAANELNPDDIVKGKLQEYNHWHFDGYDFYKEGVVSKCIDIATERGATLSLNLATHNVVKQLKSDFQKHISKFHYIFGNVEELKALTGKDNIEEIFAYFDKNQTVIATDGANGCWVKAQGQTVACHHNTPHIDSSKIINKTGAGDIWAGTYLSLALQGKSVFTCVEMANQVAGTWIQQQPGTYIDEKMWNLFKQRIATKA